MIKYNCVRNGVITNTWTSDFAGEDYWEPCFGARAWTEVIPAESAILDEEGNILVPEIPEQIIEHDAEYTITQQDLTNQLALKRAENMYAAAKSFGIDLMDTFALENIFLGITQDGMTNSVRKTMSEVISALVTGSLYDAIAEARAIPENKKDNKYITNARLLNAINKIETFMGIPLSNHL